MKFSRMTGQESSRAHEYEQVKADKCGFLDLSKGAQGSRVLATSFSPWKGRTQALHPHATEASANSSSMEGQTVPSPAYARWHLAAMENTSFGKLNRGSHAV